MSGQASAEWLLEQILGVVGPGGQALEVSLAQLLANIQAAQAGAVGNPYTARRWYGVPDIRTITTFGGETQIGTTPNQVAVFEFQAAATNAIQFNFLVPPDWRSGAVSVILYQAKKDGTTGDIVHLVNASMLAAGDDVTEAGASTQTTVAVPSGAANLLHKVTFAALFTPAAVGELWRLNYSRIGGDAADTYANNSYVLGVELQYSARSP